MLQRDYGKWNFNVVFDGHREGAAQPELIEIGFVAEQICLQIAVALGLDLRPADFRRLAAAGGEHHAGDGEHQAAAGNCSGCCHVSGELGPRVDVRSRNATREFKFPAGFCVAESLILCLQHG